MRWDELDLSLFFNGIIQLSVWHERWSDLIFLREGGGGPHINNREKVS